MNLDYDLVKKLFNNNISLNNIAMQCGVSQASISRFINSNNLIRNNITIKHDHNYVIDLYNKQMMSACEISKLINITKQSIYYILNKNNVKIREIDYKSLVDKSRKYHIDFSIFSDLNEIGAYYLGLIYADGSLSKTNMFSITLKRTDSYILIKLINDLKSNCILYDGKYTKNNKIFKNKRLIITNYKLTDILKNFGMIRDNKYKRFIPVINDNLYSHFVRGFLDGDGYVSRTSGKNRNKYIAVGFAITYKSFGVDLNRIINKYVGINTCGPYKTKNIWTIRYTHEKAEKILRWIYDNPVRKLDRKYNKWITYR